MTAITRSTLSDEIASRNSALAAPGMLVSHDQRANARAVTEHGGGHAATTTAAPAASAEYSCWRTWRALVMSISAGSAITTGLA